MTALDDGRLISSRECGFSYRPGPVTVSVSQRALEDMRKILQVSTDVDGLEVGGLLIGPPFTDHAEVLAALAPGPNAERGPAVYAFDVDHDFDWVDQTRELSKGELAVIGAWHCHPGGSLLPSDTDISLWSRLMDPGGFPLERFVALIAYRTDPGWGLSRFVVDKPRLLGTDGGAARAVCYPAE